MIKNLISAYCSILFVDLISSLPIKISEGSPSAPLQDCPQVSPPLFTCILDVTDMGSIPKEKFFDFFLEI